MATIEEKSEVANVVRDSSLLDAYAHAASNAEPIPGECLHVSKPGGGHGRCRGHGPVAAAMDGHGRWAATGGQRRPQAANGARSVDHGRPRAAKGGHSWAAHKRQMRRP